MACDRVPTEGTEVQEPTPSVLSCLPSLLFLILPVGQGWFSGDRGGGDAEGSVPEGTGWRDAVLRDLEHPGPSRPLPR